MFSDTEPLRQIGSMTWQENQHSRWLCCQRAGQNQQRRKDGSMGHNQLMQKVLQFLAN